MLKIYRLKLKQNSYEVTLHYKGVGVRVAFTDGNIYNGTPARCYERDPFKQRAIEASPMFKNKEIVIERTVEDKEKKPTPVSVRANRTSRIGAPVKPATQKPTTSVAPKIEDPDPKPEQAPENEMNFSGIAEAIAYIMQNYQKEVRTESEARKFLKEQGITAHIKKG